MLQLKIILMMNIRSYNMNGCNYGLSILHSLPCNIIALQEDWLCGNTKQQLNLVNNDFTYYGVSSMNVRLTAGLFRYGCGKNT